MNRTRSLWMLAVVAGASCVWWSGLRADDSLAVVPQSDRTAELLARIEKLEQRVQILEQGAQVVLQTTVALNDECLLPAPLTTPASPPSQPQFGIVYQLKRFIPDPPGENQSAPAKPKQFGGVEIRR